MWVCVTPVYERWKIHSGLQELQGGLGGSGDIVRAVVRAAHGERKNRRRLYLEKVREETHQEDIDVEDTSCIGYHDKRPLIQLDLREGRRGIPVDCPCQQKPE